MPDGAPATHDRVMDTSNLGPSDPLPPPPPTAPPTHGTDGFFAAVRRTGLFRSDERWVAGVAGGLARRFGIDPLLARGIFAASFLLGGLGLIAYGVGWALLPEQRDGRIHLEETIRGRFDVGMLGAIALVIVGLSRGDHWFGWGGNGVGWFGGLLLFAAIVTVIVLLVTSSSRRRAGGPRPPGPYGPYPAPGATPPPPAAAAAGSGPAGYGPAASAPYYYGPSASAAAAVTPPAPAKVRVPGPGAGMLGIVVALTMLSLAGLLLATRQGVFDGPVALTTAGIAIVLLGLAIVVSGLRGRTSGVLGFFAIVMIVIAGPLAVGESHDWHWNGHLSQSVSDSTVVLTTRDEAAAGYSVGVGDATVDLRQVALTDQTLDVPVHVGAGTLTVLVPVGSAVTADVQAGVGDVTWDVGGAHSTSSGVGTSRRHFSSPAVADGVDPQLALDVTVGAGDITIKESR
jgi:phage shock protein PspC (stress-responsive transcriptional regulator)